MLSVRLWQALVCAHTVHMAQAGALPVAVFIIHIVLFVRASAT